MKTEELQKIAKLISRKVPYQEREDCAQEVFKRCFEWQAKGSKLSPGLAYTIGKHVVVDIYRKEVHNPDWSQDNRALDTIAIDTNIALDIVTGEALALADVLPDSHNLEEQVLARLALRSLPPHIQRAAVQKLQDYKGLDSAQKAMLRAYAKSLEANEPIEVEDSPDEEPTAKTKPLSYVYHGTQKVMLDERARAKSQSIIDSRWAEEIEALELT